METKTEIINPSVGVDVTKYIGSDAYHQIVVATARNYRIIYTMSARSVLGNLTLDTWKSLPNSIRRTHARNAWVNAISNVRTDTETMYDNEEQIKSIVDRWKAAHAYTLRKDGYYTSKGRNNDYLKIGSTYEYRDPSF